MGSRKLDGIRLPFLSCILCEETKGYPRAETPR